MNVLIVEDEKLASERLVTLLQQYDPAIRVIGSLESIEETVSYLSCHPHPDVMMLDIHLSDGLSFEIFRQVRYDRPVIFTTAYDQYALDAFRLYSVDYILKPVTREALATAFHKLKSLMPGFVSPEYRQLLKEFSGSRFKSRFLGKVGQRLFFIDTGNVSYFRADNKIVYLVDREGKRYVIDYTMEQLAELVDPRQFFRLNRSFIVNIDAIEQVKPYYNSRLKLSVAGSGSSEEMIVSREKVSEFKSWAES